MAMLSVFAGLWVVMRAFDDDRHHLSHIHIFAGKPNPNMPSAVIALNGDVLAIDKNFPIRKLKLVSDWILLHETELISTWNKLSNGEGDVEPIEPLR